MISKLIPNRIKKIIRNIVLSGNNVTCPICEKNFITFLPFGAEGVKSRMNAMCPNCFSLERTRVFWLILKKNDFFSSKKSILHVAPEKMLFEKFNSYSKLDYKAIDKFEAGYTRPKGTISMDVTDLKFTDNWFDFILCSHVLEHVIDDIKAMSEMYRVMKKGGWGIIQVPLDFSKKETFEDFNITSSEDRIKAFGQHDHVRIYGVDYLSKLEKTGFEVTAYEVSEHFDENTISRFGLNCSEKIIIVIKH